MKEKKKNKEHQNSIEKVSNNDSMHQLDLWQEQLISASKVIEKLKISNPILELSKGLEKLQNDLELKYVPNFNINNIVRESELSKIAKSLSNIPKIEINSRVEIALNKLHTFSKIDLGIDNIMLEFLYNDSYKNQLQDVFNIPNIDQLDINHFKQTDYSLFDLNNIEPKSEILLLNELSRVERIITDIYHHNDNIFRIAPDEFEDMIAELLRKQNFHTEVSKRTRDGGYDIIAVQSVGDFPIKFLVECKKYSLKNKVGVNIVRSFRDVVNTNCANKGIIVTSSYFSLDAEKYRSQHSPYCLDFKDHDDVIAWVNKYVK